MDDTEEKALAPFTARVPTAHRARAALSTGTRALAMAARSPVTRRAAALGIALGIGYRLDRALRTALQTAALDPQYRRRLPDTEQLQPATQGWVQYTNISLAMVFFSPRDVDRRR